MTADQSSALVALLGLVTMMHGCDSLGALYTVIGEGITAVIPADLITVNIIDLSGEMGGSRGSFHPPIMPPELIWPHFDRYLHQHPLVQEIQRTGDGTPRRISDHLSVEEFMRTDLYRTVFVPLRSLHQIGFSVLTAPGLVIGIGVNREHEDFSDAELQTARLVWEQIPAAVHHVQLREVHTREIALAMPESLTEREREVLVYLRAGMTNQQIATAMIVGRRTVEKHLEKLYAKLGVRTRTGAVHAVWPPEGTARAG